jgi:hypothetical protein
MTRRTPIHEVSPLSAAYRPLAEVDAGELSEALAASVLGGSPAPVARAAVPSPTGSGGTDALYGGRSEALLGDFGMTSTRSYSLTDLQTDPAALDAVFSGRTHTT